ncbi:uncharacterized protein TRIVIDRAFT_223891 [Trichoderma virens Gv29-8]|uniref:Uncharacterized protein n=1 Tax=Hypocrea virens (strain Gv29-8 / FGSC 10586) TaxID=413071 RepID=G9MYF2_HYPVG|nr:uncharacterized protein TRIVIDRAFT_223891 [Trichoderma virens Gv29-8]EHK20574.1 hypothetical protein TRIVIDRAFT_223891 [Trichoderma virens Gv29-8]UKZ53032.1 hypothetical protein TrVGV298_006819 [Trichoderma virens]
MAVTLLQALTKRNPALENFAHEGSNTTSPDWKKVENWRPWKEFNFKNLLSVYQDALAVTGDPPELEHACDYDREIWDEHSLDIFLVRFIFPAVNWALNQAAPTLGWGNKSIYLAPGSWTGMSDWALVSKEQMPAGYQNLLPGDTKLSNKWRPEMRESRNDYTRYQWSLPVSQVSSYALDSGCRYGFIITDLQLIVLRFSREPIGQGLALSRSRRQPQQTHQRIASGSTDVSSQFEAMSFESSGAASYASGNHNDREYAPPEYVIIPWDAHGEKLTMKMALFCLCLMAAGGEGKIDVSYPPLDSWRSDMQGFRHNASGRFLEILPIDAVIFNSREAEPGVSQT